jgi:HEAT repeat protein
LIIEEVYPGTLERRGQGGGRSAISELRFFTELDFSGGLPRVLADLQAKDELCGRHAVQLLAGLKAQGIALLQPLIRGKPLSPVLQPRLLDILLRHPLPESAAPLSELLPQLTAPQQKAALEALITLSGAAVPYLSQLLADPSPGLAGGAARALGRVGDEASRTILLEHLGRGSEPLRAAIVEGLTTLRRSEDLQEVWRILQTRSSSASQPWLADAILTLGKMGAHTPQAPQIGATLGALWPRATSFEARYRLLVSLGRLDPRGQFSLLHQGALLSDPVLRWVALQQLGPLADRQTVALLRRALDDSDPRVRAAAASALGNHEKNRTLGHELARRLRQERWPLAAMAMAAALGSHCTEEGHQALFAAIKSGRSGIDLAALESLVRCHPRGIEGELLAVAQSNTWRLALRLRALELISPTMAQAKATSLVGLFADLRRRAPTDPREERIAVALAHLLALIPQAAEELGDTLLHDPQASLRKEAAWALSQRCLSTGQPPLRRAAAQDPSSHVRSSARRALEHCRFNQ